MRSPWRDNGYDVSDYFDVDRRLGTLGDLVELLRAARERGVRVITDLVVNHTSDEHPWFQAAVEPGQSLPGLLRLARRTPAGGPGAAR